MSVKSNKKKANKKQTSSKKQSPKKQKKTTMSSNNSKPVVAAIESDEEPKAAKVKKEKIEKPKTEPRGIIKQILEHFTSGKDPKEIKTLRDKDGNLFNATTVSIQVAKYKKNHPELYPPVAKEPKQPKEKKAKKEKEAA